MRQMILNLFYFLSGFSIRKKNRFVFGSWFGQKFADNPKYIFDYLIENYPENQYFWITQSTTSENNQNYSSYKNVTFIKRNSLKSFIVLLTSYYGFVSHGYTDLSSINLFRNGILVQLWHGYPIKKIVADAGIEKEKKENYYDKYNYFLASSSEEIDRMLSAFRFKGITHKNIIQSGKPRNDIFAYSKNQNIRSNLNISIDKKIIVYLPTYRNSADIFSFSNLSRDYKEKLVEKNIVILEKQHFVKKNNINFNSDDAVIMLNEQIDTQEILCIADLLVTDYSSVYTDYCLLNRPIVHFLFDGDKYITEDQGTYSSFEIDSCGPIVFEIEELFNEYLFKLNEADFLDRKRSANSYRFNEYSTENNSYKIIQYLLKEGDNG